MSAHPLPFAVPARRVVWLVIIVCLGLTVGGCSLFNSPGNGSPEPQPAGPSTEVPEEPAITGFGLQRQEDTVRVGQTQPLSEVTVGDRIPFLEGNLVTVDASGEALIDGDIEGNQCVVFVFFDSALRKAACSESELAASSVACVEEGSAVFGRCANMLVQTPGAEFQLVGTWAQVIYLPARQMSVMVVYDGAVDASSSGSATRVGAEEVYYTAPDAMLARIEIPGLPARAATPWHYLPVISQRYGLDKWLSRGQEHVRSNGVAVTDPIKVAAGPDLAVTLEGRTPGDSDQKLIASERNRSGLPVRARVINLGGAPAEPFKLSVEGTGPDGTYVRPFIVAGQESPTYPRSDEPLGPGEEITFDGVVLFDLEAYGKDVTVIVQVDSCVGEEFQPEDCRVSELDEDNNLSAPYEATVSMRPEPDYF